MALRNTNLKSLREPKITRLHNNRLQVERWFGPRTKTLVYSDKVAGELLAAFATADSATGPTGKSKPVRTNEAFTDVHLVEVFADVSPDLGGMYVYERYVTLTSTWTNEEPVRAKAPRRGLRTMEYVEVALPGTAVEYDEEDVGVSTLDFGGKTLYLAEVDDDAGDDRIARVRTLWMEPGTLGRTEAQGPVAGTIDIVIQAFATQPSVANTVLTRKAESDFEGIKTYNYHFTTRIGEQHAFSYPTTLDIVDPGTVSLEEQAYAVHTEQLYEAVIDGGAPNQQGFIRTTGMPVLTEIDDVEEVTDIEPINRRVFGTVAYVKPTRASRKPVTATVREWITSNPPAPSTPYANNLASYGVWITESAVRMRGVGSKLNKSTQYLPQTKLLNSAGQEAATSTAESILYFSFTEDLSDRRESTTRTLIRAEQVGTAPLETGLYEVKPTFAFRDLNTGTPYYSVKEITL